MFFRLPVGCLDSPSFSWPPSQRLGTLTFRPWILLSGQRGQEVGTGLGVGGQCLPALPALGAILSWSWHLGEAGASALGASQKLGQERGHWGGRYFCRSRCGLCWLPGS